jgi:hypothetical protein
MSSADRNDLVLLLMQREMKSQVDAQSKFFKLVRPDQHVVRNVTIDKTKIEDGIRQIWKRNGWAGLTSSWMPMIRQIAENNHIDVLTTLYDYIYRLTSDAVHFNTQVLMRTGWGKRVVDFSPKNFNAYYVDYARTYGLLLFCCYFELFGRILRPDRRVARLIVALRFDLVSQMRWPEMVTHEQLNLRPVKDDATPRLVYRYLDAHRRKRKLLTTPSDRTMTRHFNRLLNFVRRSPRARQEIRRIEGSQRRLVRARQKFF